MNPGIETVVDYLSSVPAWYLATTEGDQPHVRPFSFAAALNDRIWFCTGKGKDVYRELKANPRFEASAWQPGHGWLVLRGEADFTEEANDLIRRAGFAHMRSLGEEYDGVEDPNLVLFAVKGPQAWVRDIDGSETEVVFESESFDPFAEPEEEAAEVEYEAEAAIEAEADGESVATNDSPFESASFGSEPEYATEYESETEFQPEPQPESEIELEPEPEPEPTPSTSTYIVESSLDDMLQQPEAFYVEIEEKAS